MNLVEAYDKPVDPSHLCFHASEEVVDLSKATNVSRLHVTTAILNKRLGRRTRLSFRSCHFCQFRYSLVAHLGLIAGYAFIHWCRLGGRRRVD